jgi:hypothetical protein
MSLMGNVIEINVLVCPSLEFAVPGLKGRRSRRKAAGVPTGRMCAVSWVNYFGHWRFPHHRLLLAVVKPLSASGIENIDKGKKISTKS